MSQVDDLQNAAESVAQRSEEAAAREAARRLADLERAPLAPTAELPAQGRSVPLREIRAAGNMRAEAPHVHELARSIKELGLLNPLTVTPLADGGEHRYQLVAGTRRLRALWLLDPSGEREVPVVERREISEVEAIELQFAENTYEPPQPIEYARTVRKMLALRPQWSAAQIARRHGLSPAWVQKHLRLLNGLPPEVVARYEQGDLSFTIADILRKGVAAERISEDEAAELAEQVAAGTLPGETAIRTAGGMKLGDGYVPPPPENYDQISRDLDETRRAARDAPARRDDQDWETTDGSERILISRRESEPSGGLPYSGGAVTDSAPAPPGAEGGPSPEHLERYLIGRLLQEPECAELRASLRLPEDGVWRFAFATPFGRLLALLPRIAAAMLQSDGDPPAWLRPAAGAARV